MSIQDFLDKTKLDIEIEHASRNRLFNFRVVDSGEYYTHYRVLLYYHNRKVETYISVPYSSIPYFNRIYDDKNKLIPYVLDLVLKNVGAGKLNYKDWLKYNNHPVGQDRLRKSHNFNKLNSSYIRKFCGENWGLLESLVPDQNTLVENGFLDQLKKEREKPTKNVDDKDFLVDDDGGLTITAGTSAGGLFNIIYHTDTNASIDFALPNIDHYRMTGTLNSIESRLNEIQNAIRDSTDENANGEEQCDEDVPF